MQVGTPLDCTPYNVDHLIRTADVMLHVCCISCFKLLILYRRIMHYLLVVVVLAGFQFVQNDFDAD